MRNWVTVHYHSVTKVNRHAYNLSFYTCQDDLRSKKRTGQIHDMLPCSAAAEAQQGNICSVLHQRFELQKTPPGRHYERANG